MTRTAKELAEILGAVLEGDGTAELHNVAAPERAGARDTDVQWDARRHRDGLRGWGRLLCGQTGGGQREEGEGLQLHFFDHLGTRNCTKRLP